jgi:cytochrome c553
LVLVCAPADSMGQNAPPRQDVNSALTRGGAALTQHDVLPILLRHCSACHGARQQEGNLDLRTKVSMLRGGKSGAAFVTGQPLESRIVQRLQSGECPPSKRLVEASVKPVGAADLAKIIEWIAAGAPEAADEPDIAGTPQDPLVHEADRQFWSFRPLRPVSVPSVNPQAPVRNPVDLFVLSKLEERGLSFAPEASKNELLRRVCFDLTGLPPTPEQTLAFLAEAGPQAYENLVDRLLASPRYGERWGRYWLDVAGYSDVEGRREQHLPRPFAYRYRDYVIESFNADKPYDRFLLEQLAGDELADYETAPAITKELYDNLVATAFLRMGPDPTWANITGFVPDRLEVVADAMDVFGSGVLGLTLKCARCHDHKFDPIPQRDYYRLIDLFKGAYDEYDWLKPDHRAYGGAVNSGKLDERSLSFVLPEERKAWSEHNERVQRQIDTKAAELKNAESRLREKYRAAQLAGLPESVRAEVERMLATPAARRTPEQVQLAERYEKKLTPDSNELKKFDPEFKKSAEELAALSNQKWPEPRISALWDRGEPSATYLYRRGEPERAGILVKAGVLAVLMDERIPFDVRAPWPGARKTGRRLALGRWLTHPQHPLTSRVMVNRVWQHHFGQGLVRSPGNFGKTGSPPTHPELLDWLAQEFVRQGWRLKSLHRLIVTSRAYRQSSRLSSKQLAIDPENALVSRMPLRRLDAEAVWDSLVVVAGSLVETCFGPPVPAQARGDGVVVPGKTGGGWRRSIYAQQLRKDIPTVMEVFDLPIMNPNCLERSQSIVAAQALHLRNDRVVRELAERFAERVVREAGTDLARQIQRAYLIALTRIPSVSEEAASAELIRKISEAQTGLESAPGETPADAQGRFTLENNQALATLCHALMNSAEFLHVD